MKFIIPIIFLIGSISEANAVLPPFFQGKREIETILSSKELSQYLPSGDLIAQITKTPTGYMIITNKRIVGITVKYSRSDHIGPVRFSLEFQTLTVFNEASGDLSDN